jgi:hypothetical protein
MKLSEWDKSVQYGNKICTELKEKGYNVSLSPYTMYDGKKGLYIYVYDVLGEVYKFYATGICETFEKMQIALQTQRNRIIQEC